MVRVYINAKRLLAEAGGYGGKTKTDRQCTHCSKDMRDKVRYLVSHQYLVLLTFSRTKYKAEYPQ